MKKDSKATAKADALNFKKMFNRKWCLTVHGANPDGDCPILERLKTLFDQDKYTLAAVAWQTGRQGVHPHWQIYFQTAKFCRMKECIAEALGSEYDFHIQGALGTQKANLNYVYAVDKQYELGWIHYAKGHNTPSRYRQDGLDNLLWLRDNMKPWQAEITQRVTSKSSYRDILWVWEPKGNTGKTYLAKYLHYFHGAIVTGGKSADMKHAIARWNEITGHYPVILIIDVPRSTTFRKQAYETVEQMKNSLFFSGKYESTMVASKYPPHIVVFSNEKPRFECMSEDRWIVKYIDPQTHTLTQLSE